MQLERSETVGYGSHGILNFSRILVKDRFATRNDFRAEGESVTGRRLRVYGTIFAWLQLCGLCGHCYGLRFDLHIRSPFLRASAVKDRTGADAVFYCYI